MIERDDLSGLWLYSHSTGRPGAIGHDSADIARLNEHLGLPPARDREMTGAFDAAAAAARDDDAGRLTGAYLEDLYPVVFPVVPHGEGVAVHAPGLPAEASTCIGTLFGRHGHLVATLTELTGEPVGVPGWVEYSWIMEHTGRPEVFVNLSFEEPAHADLSRLAAERGRVLRYPARPARYGPAPVAPYTAPAGTEVTWRPPTRDVPPVDLASYPHLRELAGAPLQPPHVADVLDTGAQPTWYVPAGEVRWELTTSRHAVHSHQLAGFQVLAVVHPPTGTWTLWAVSADGSGSLLDGNVYRGTDPVTRAQPRSVVGVAVTDRPDPVYLVTERVYELDDLGARVVIDRAVFATETFLETASARSRALAAARSRALQARSRFVRRAADYGSDRAVVELFDPVEVYLRDRWTCQLCGGPVDPALRWPDPGSATPDHRVPVSAGGDHTRANVQLAHAACNTAKSDRLTTVG